MGFFCDITRVASWTQRNYRLESGVLFGLLPSLIRNSLGWQTLFIIRDADKRLRACGFGFDSQPSGSLVWICAILDMKWSQMAYSVYYTGALMSVPVPCGSGFESQLSGFCLVSRLSLYDASENLRFFIQKKIGFLSGGL